MNLRVRSVTRISRSAILAGVTDTTLLAMSNCQQIVRDVDVDGNGAAQVQDLERFRSAKP